MRKPKEELIESGDYHFSIIPNRMWVLKFLPDGRRLMCRGNPFTDKRYSKFLDGLDYGEVSEVLRPLIKKYCIKGRPILLDADEEGFKFVEGDVAHRINSISGLLRKLVDSYCSK